MWLRLPAEAEERAFRVPLTAPRGLEAKFRVFDVARGNWLSSLVQVTDGQLVIAAPKGIGELAVWIRW